MMTREEITVFLLAITLLLLAARLLGEAARILHQPAVLGELIAGILLGPTVLGSLLPEVGSWLFPQTGAVPDALQAITTLSIALYLLVAGIEIDLSTVLRQGRAAALISAFGMVVPFALGFSCGWYLPQWFGAPTGADRLLFAMFLGTVLSISALPVIAKILFDLGMYRSDFGMMIVSVAVVDDIGGWLLFAVILGLMGAEADLPLGVGGAVALTLLFTAVMLTLGRKAVHRLLPRIQAYSSWPGGVLSFAVVGGLSCGALTEWIGVHAIFGAFIFGVAIGDSSHLRQRTKAILDHFISFIFAPLFFASIGLTVNFATNFRLPLVLAVLAVACVGKLAGCSFAGRLAGFSHRESLAIGFGMNARGAMAIILGLLALQAGLIGEEMFVAIVVMSLITSMSAGGVMQRLLRRERPVRLLDCLSSRGFVGRLESTTVQGAIRELARAAAASTTRTHDAEAIASAVLAREELAATGLGNGIAVPHARLEGLRSPVVAVGLSPSGLDFDAPDGEPARVVVLILTHVDDHQGQLGLLADVARIIKDPAVSGRNLAGSSYVEFLALLRSRAAG